MLSAVEKIKKTYFKFTREDSYYGKSSYGKHLRQVADGKILY